MRGRTRLTAIGATALAAAWGWASVSDALESSAAGMKTIRDRAGRPAASRAAALPPPNFGRSVDIGLISGVVGVRPAHGIPFTLTPRDRNIPVGSEINTVRGAVDLRTAKAGSLGKPGAGIQDGHFSGGTFTIVQRPRQDGLAVLTLLGRAPTRALCPSESQGSAARRELSGQVLARLRSNVHGQFRTRGAYSAATARGTEWEMVDRCDGTLTRVYRGVVAVLDFRTGKTTMVTAGHTYLAPAR